jgi:hypothetical protein
LPARRAAHQKAEVTAALWHARCQSAAGGTFRLTQAEMGDVEFMRDHGPLIHAASMAGRVDYGP